MLSMKPREWKNANEVDYSLSGIDLDKVGISDKRLAAFTSLQIAKWRSKGGGDTTCTRWLKMFESKGVDIKGFSSDKRGLTNIFIVKPETLTIACQHVVDVRAWLYQTYELGLPGHGMLMYVVPKNEAYKKAKLDEGKHRSIQFPDLAVSIIEQFYTSWIYETEDSYEIRSLDDLMAMHHLDDVEWMLGGDAVKVVQIAERFGWNVGTRLMSLDVTGWDRHLNHQVVNELFTSLVRDKRIASGLAHGLCGHGIYSIGQSLFKFKEYETCLWGSGIMKTLSGNCLIHAGLLRSLGIRGIVQGDDAVIAAGNVNVFEEYKGFGLEVSKSKSSTADGFFEFTKREFDLYAKVVKISDGVEKKAKAYPLADYELTRKGVREAADQMTVALSTISWCLDRSNLAWLKE